MIGRLLIAGIATTAFACAAAAADLPVPAGGVAYHPGMVPSPYYDWSGFYLGGQAGALFTTDSRISQVDVPTNTTTNLASFSSRGFSGGGYVGANMMFLRSFVLGVEGDFDALTNKNSTISADGTNRLDIKLNSLATVRGRFGLTADRLLVYVAGGWAWGQEKFTRTQLNGAANAATAGTVEANTTSRDGWTIGGGFEYAIATNWVARLDYLYARLHPASFTFPVSQARIGAPFEPLSQVTVGIAFKFNPVVQAAPPMPGGPLPSK